MCTAGAEKTSINFPPKKIFNKRKAKRKKEGCSFPQNFVKKANKRSKTKNSKAEKLEVEKEVMGKGERAVMGRMVFIKTVSLYLSEHHEFPETVNLYLMKR